MSDINDVVDIVTQEWVEMFQNPENRTGLLWRLALSGCLPDGVDPSNPKVIEILNQQQEA